MKLLFGVTFIVLSVVVHVVKSGSSSEEEEKMMAEVNDCKIQSGASDADVKAMMEHAVPTSKQAKCLNACVLNKFGIMKDEKFLPEALQNLIEMGDESVKAKDGKTLKEALKDISDECKAVTDNDKCEAAAKIISCLNKAAEKRGFDPNTF